ncbi:unnamed protein product [Prorocentrum cordatum]|uniref:Uncharacterized protein n=1 Tax=Prorocentrum cordatum TaxID=2364126 RepID=A0ABN9T9E7_9DINO|nr:unnamed protein product [Polarella glacialis]
MAGHGGGAGGGSKATWDCSCGVRGNWASRAACRARGAERPPWARPRSASASARGPRSGATAGTSKEVKALRRELDGLEKENKALQRSASRDAAGAEEARDSDRVAELRGLITKLEALGSEDEATVSLGQEQRLAKPPHEQLRAIDSNIGELDKRCVAKQEQVAKRKEALANAEKELEAVLAERTALSAERAKVAASHLAELAAKAATPAERGRLFLDSLGGLKAAVAGQVPSEVAAAVQLVERRGKQEAASVAAQARPSDAGGSARAEPVEVLASQEWADAADATMDDALDSAQAADLVGPGGDCDCPSSGLSREKIRGVIAAACAMAADRRSGGSEGVIKKKRQRPGASKDTFEIMTVNGSRGAAGAGGTLEIRTDCKLLVTGFAAGKARRCARGRSRIEVRRDFWQAAGSFGGQQSARVTEVKGHAALRSVHDGHARMGDRARDSFAKKGVKLHPMGEAAMERIEMADANCSGDGPLARRGAAAGEHRPHGGRRRGRGRGGAHLLRAQLRAAGRRALQRRRARLQALAMRRARHGGLGRERHTLALRRLRGPLGAEGAGAAAAAAAAAAALTAQARGGTHRDDGDAEESGGAAGAVAEDAPPRRRHVSFDESHCLWTIGEGSHRLVSCAVCGCYAEGARVIALRSP